MKPKTRTVATPLAIIQARMTSRRFPGKVLAPLAGRPVLWHVVERVSQAVPRDRIRVATSREPTDDPIAEYADSLGVKVFRGDLSNVLQRFQDCVRAEGADWFFRISADSPLMDPAILRAMLPLAQAGGQDLITNVQVRTFPKGRSAELVRTEPFLRLDPASLSPDQREHVTLVYYDHPERFRILNLESGDADAAQSSLALDVPEDLPRLESMLLAEARPRRTQARARSP